jgi:hypothetical protein
MAEKSIQPSRSIGNAADSPNVVDALKGALAATAEQSPEILSGLLGAVCPPALIPIRIFHAGVKGHFLQQAMAELEALRKKGEIREEYLKSNEAAACMSDLLDYIDKISPDPKRYEAIRTAFLKILSQGETGKNAPHAQQLLRVIYELSAGEIAVLAAIFKMGGTAGSVSHKKWRSDVANQSGLLRTEIVMGIEEVLVGKRLVTPINTGMPSQIIWGQQNRLTPLGVEVCEHIQQEQS